MVICVFNFSSKTQTSRHLRKKSKIMVQDRNFYHYKFRFSPPKVIQILILPSQMLIVNYVGVMEKNSFVCTFLIEYSVNVLVHEVKNCFCKAKLNLIN